MRVWTVPKPAGIDSLVLGETPTPRPGPGQVLVRMRAASLFALQLAHAAGARVIATSSNDGKLAQAKTLGASDGVNYRDHPEWNEEVLKLTDGRGVDHVLEVGGASTLPRSIAATRLGGQVHQIGVRGGAGGEIDPSVAMRKGLILRGIYVGSRQMFEAMNHAIALHRIAPVIDRVFGFDQAKGAYRHLESQAHVGKVVIRVD